MGRIQRVLATAVVAAAAFAGLAPAGAAAAEPDTRIPTAFETGSFVLSLPTQPDGLGPTYPMRVLTASARLAIAEPHSLWLSGKLVTFTSGGLPVCSAVTRGGTFEEFHENGVARCNVNPLTPGGLRAVLTGSVQASFAGDDFYQPAAGNLGLVGYDIKPPCYAFCT